MDDNLKFVLFVAKVNKLLKFEDIENVNLLLSRMTW